MAKVEFADISVAPIILATILGILIIAAITLWMGPHIKVDKPSFTSMFQGAIRPNVYLGIAASVALFDSAGLTLVSVSIAVSVPLVNVLGVIILVRYASMN